MTLFLIILFTVVGLLSHGFAGFCGYRYGRRVELEFQTKLAAMEKLGKFVADTVRG